MIKSYANSCLQKGSDYQITSQDSQREALKKGVIGTTLKGAAVALATLNHSYAPIVEKRLFRC